MGEQIDRSETGRAVLLSADWWEPSHEATFVLRSIAGALSRLMPVEVIVPGEVGTPRPDGVFDISTIGQESSTGKWPAAGNETWPTTTREPRVVIFDPSDRDALGLAQRLAATPSLVALWSVAAALDDASPAGTILTFTPTQYAALADHPSTSRRALQQVSLHVPVSDLAIRQPHNGLGFTNYLLVLTDRTDLDGDEENPTPLAAWLIARFPRQDIVVIENAMASVWNHRSLRGWVSVDTRTDLLRLISHAWSLIDLRPGPFIARECVEALRCGVPIVAPTGTAGADQSAHECGLHYSDPAELLACVERLLNPEFRSSLSDNGRRAGEERHGDRSRLTGQLEAAMA